MPQLSAIGLNVAVYDPKFKISAFKVLVDYYPMKNGIFSISTGFYAGTNKISATAKVDDYELLVAINRGEHPVFEIDDLVIKPKPDGTLSGQFILGNTVKPYFGLGLGRTIANNRIGFKFDIGTIYQGHYSFESPQVTGHGSAVNSGTNDFLKDNDVPTWIADIWPLINFSLSYRFN
jgi:hypothetical protein